MDSNDSIHLAGVVPDWKPSVPLVESAIYHQDFLSDVFQNPRLQDPAVLNNAMRRYEVYWLPLLKSHPEDETLEPPIDVHWMWHCHMLAPVAYANDCQRVLGFVPNHTLRERNSEEFYAILAKTEKLWTTLYPLEPFDCNSANRNFGDLNGNVKDGLGVYESKFKHDLIEATKRQKGFYYQVSLPHYKDLQFLRAALDRYIRFLHLKKTHPELFTVPMYDIDLMWHTHQLSPLAYANDTRELLGKVLNHDDKDQDRGPESKLSRSGQETRARWRQLYGGVMAEAGTCYRGDSLVGEIQRGYMEIDKEGFSVKFLTLSRHMFSTKMDPRRMPVALECTLRVEKLSVRGGDPSDVIHAKVCCPKTGSAIELRTAEGTPVEWSPNQEVVVENLRGKPLGDVDLVLVNRSGVWGALVGTSLPTLSLMSDFYVDQKVAPRQNRPLTLEAAEGDYRAVMTATLTGVRPRADQTMTIVWGRPNGAVLTTASKDELGPINLPYTFLRLEKPASCTICKHSVTMGDVVLYTVRVISCNQPKLNVVQVFSDNKVVATSELIGSDQLPRPSQVESKTTTITLDTKRGENGMIVKNVYGDWGIVKGCRTHSIEGSATQDPVVIPGRLEASLTLLTPYRMGRFTLTPRPLWSRLGLPWATQRRFELFGTEGVSVEMESSTVHLGRDCQHIAEFIAVVFSVWI